MITTGNTWQTEMDKYISTVDEAYKTYHDNVVSESKIIEDVLKDDETAIKQVEQASDSLARELQS
jgi:hypothetical protein